MFTNNPYAQAGWYNPQNPHSINGQPWNANAPHPPTFGALPSQSGSTTTKLTFEFPDVLNCSVTGPGGKTYLSIVSHNTSTLISKPSGEPVARIEWQAQPWIEIRNVVERQLVSTWLPLSADLRWVHCGDHLSVWPMRWAATEPWLSVGALMLGSLGTDQSSYVLFRWSWWPNCS